MKRIAVLFLLMPYLAFSQEYRGFNLYAGSPYSDEGSYSDTGNKVTSTLLPVFALLGTVGLNVGMREGVYRNHYQDNWLGTVNGAFTLGLAGTLIGTGISYGIYKLTNERFDRMNVLWGTFLGLAGGVTAAFFPPFKQAFRENAFLYYTFPVLFTAGLTYVIIDIWFGKGSVPRKQSANALMRFHLR
jgi:hypothetical protein